MRKPNPIAVCCSDLHLTLHPPACRADEDWMEVQARYLRQVKKLADGLPIICAGDIFDKWNAAPELINFALKHLPDGMICVPGQHDLPNHRIDLMHRSGYGVLVEAEKIKDISGSLLASQRFPFAVYGFGWQQDIEALTDQKTDPDTEKALIHIAVIHRYCWTTGNSYPGAPDEGKVDAFKKQLRGYDVAVFGDNHKGFLSHAGNCVVMNCGTFIRRKSDELEYTPQVGIIHSDGTVESHKLSTSKDVFETAAKEKQEVPVDMQSFLSMLQDLGESGLNFRDEVERYLKADDIDPAVKEIILTAINEKEI